MVTIASEEHISINCVFRGHLLFHASLAWSPMQLLYLGARLGGGTGMYFVPCFLVFVIAINGTFDSIYVQHYLAYL